MSREVIKYTLISLGGITACLAIYYTYLTIKDKRK